MTNQFTSLRWHYKKIEKKIRSVGEEVEKIESLCILLVGM